VSADRLERLNAIARSEGWRAAVDTVFADDPAMVHYVTDAGRTRFLDLLPLGPEATVLEVGPGLGQITTALAPRARRVHALELDAGQAAFVLERCRQSGRANVSVACGGSDGRLPYASERFDLAVLNLVLEWCASRDPAEDQAVVARRLLAECARVLRPGGSLYLATKNRFALRYLLGGRDEHAHQMRFGSALPRALLRLFLGLRGLGRPGGLVFSYRELRRMLAAAGFGDARAFWAAPEVRFAERHIPADGPSIAAARRAGGFAQGDSRSTRLLMPLVPAGLVKHVAHGLVFLARKGGRPPGA
jgi:SAM-dependent methyltransferase